MKNNVLLQALHRMVPSGEPGAAEAATSPLRMMRTNTNDIRGRTEKKTAINPPKRQERFLFPEAELSESI